MKAKIVNNQLEYFKQPDNVLGDTDALATEQGYKDLVIPSLTYSQKMEGLIETENLITYEVVDKTVAELEQEINIQADTEDMRVDEVLIKKLFQSQVELLPEVEQIEYSTLFDSWRIKDYKVDEKLSYNGKLYKVIQAHTSQYDWLPDASSALYLEVAPAGTIPVFKQPTGSHDAYLIGDKVYFPDADSSIYESTIDNNVWEPLSVGAETLWKLVE